MASRGVNKVILIGYLGQDPEVRYMQNGGAVANVTLATSDTWKDKNTGEIREKTEWHKIVFFNRLAEIAGEYLKKGSQVYIEGSLQTKKWQDQNGIDRYVTEIIVSVGGTMQMLSNNRNINNRSSSIEHSKSTVNEVNKETSKNSQENYDSNKIIDNNSSSLDFDDEDIPF